MRLIDADAIVYTHEVARSLDDRHNWNELCVTQDDIECMPTIDAVEVVRCHKCIHWDEDTVRRNSNDVTWWNEAVCRKYSDDIWEAWKDADWFCADGERRNDG